MVDEKPKPKLRLGENMLERLLFIMGKPKPFLVELDGQKFEVSVSNQSGMNVVDFMVFDPDKRGKDAFVYCFFNKVTGDLNHSFGITGYGDVKLPWIMAFLDGYEVHENHESAPEEKPSVAAIDRVVNFFRGLVCKIRL